MGRFRDLMEEQLRLHGKAPKAVEAYLGAMRGLVAYHMRAPDELRLADIHAYQHHLLERGLSGSTVNIAVCAIRFFYRHCLPRRWDVRLIRFQRKPRRLPVVLSRGEVELLIGVVSNRKHRVLILVLYGAGLRLDEARHLKAEDMDSARMVIHVRRGKGAKPREALLPRRLLEELRGYWREEGPLRPWLFPGADPEVPISPSTVQRVVSRAGKRAGLTKRVTPHVLRHAFATHLLEAGVSIRIVQRLLGHAHIGTTLGYTHVTDDCLRETQSPLDTP